MEPLTQETQAIWNQNAAFWDSMLGDEGNRFHRAIVEPTVLNLLSLQPGEHVLEVACGNGAFARKMAHAGVTVVATDFSAVLLDRAKERTRDNADRIEYRLVDATDETQLLHLGEHSFDAAVCNMGLMDMPVVEPLFRALRRVLKTDGRFVFSIQHPSFNSNGTTKLVESEDRSGELITTYAIKVWRYRTAWAERGIGIEGQPAPHYYFHRPLSALLNACFQAGFVVDGLEEPSDPSPMNESMWYSWANYKELPAVLAARLRLK